LNKLVATNPKMYFVCYTCKYHIPCCSLYFAYVWNTVFWSLCIDCIVMLFWFLVTRLKNVTVALAIRFCGHPGRCRHNNEEIFSLSELESNPFTYG